MSLASRCTERAHVVEKVIETDHIPYGSGRRTHTEEEKEKMRKKLEEQERENEKRKRKSYRKMRGDPNDWVNKEADYRFDLFRPLRYAVVVIFSLVWAYKWVAMLFLVPWMGFYLHQDHTKNHSDIPFKQYLRFLLNRAVRHASNLALSAKAVAKQLSGLFSTGGGGIWAWLRKRTRGQLAHATLVMSVFGGFAAAGFAAPGLVLIGFYIGA